MAVTKSGLISSSLVGGAAAVQVGALIQPVTQTERNTRYMSAQSFILPVGVLEDSQSIPPENVAENYTKKKMLQDLEEGVFHCDSMTKKNYNKRSGAWFFPVFNPATKQYSFYRVSQLANSGSDFGFVRKNGTNKPKGDQLKHARFRCSLLQAWRYWNFGHPAQQIRLLDQDEVIRQWYGSWSEHGPAITTTLEKMYGIPAAVDIEDEDQHRLKDIQNLRANDVDPENVFRAISIVLTDIQTVIFPPFMFLFY